MDQIAPTNAPRPGFASWLGETNSVTAMFLAAGRIQGMINLGGGLPDPAVYPVPELADMAKSVVENHPHDCLNYSPIDGLPDLRDLIAERYSDEHLHLTRENVIILSGGMQGLDLVGKVLVDNGGIIAAQSPTYLGALDAWKPRHPVLRPFDAGAEGFDAVSAFQGAQFAYTVPNFSNPSGRLVDLPTREKLVDAAHETGTWLVEDDPYGGLQFDGEPVRRMISLSGAKQEKSTYRGPVVYMGTISKAIAPGFRVGWCIADPEIVKVMTTAKQSADLSASGIGQRIAIEAISTGLLDRLQPQIVTLYRERRDALLAALEEHLSEWFTWEKPVGGMFIWVEARDPSLDTFKLLPAALDAGICYAPGLPFDPAGENRGAMRLNFTFNTPERLAEGISRLAAAMKRRQEWDR